MSQFWRVKGALKPPFLSCSPLTTLVLNSTCLAKSAYYLGVKTGDQLLHHLTLVGWHEVVLSQTFPALWLRSLQVELLCKSNPFFIVMTGFLHDIKMHMTRDMTFSVFEISARFMAVQGWCEFICWGTDEENVLVITARAGILVSFLGFSWTH